MAPELLQAAIIAVGVVVGTVFVVWRWLRGVTCALDAFPQVKRDADDALRASRAAHTRVDEHAERIARIEARWEAHDREHERSEEQLGKRLDRIEAKLDALIERR